jgi:tape measure domain-containing protein
MQFDNAQFQKGVADTTKSLDSLKSGLNLSGAAKSLEGLQSAGSRFSLAGIATGVDQLNQKFSAMSIVAITAITNIANKAVNAGLEIAKSLTIDPIKTGLEEYETNLNSIQTILANTQVSGATLNDVNHALEELNHYSDQTIYNFSEMARNIGTFTAAGVDLETATSSIKGIANLAALSGSSSAQASGAMYQLSQEISAGKVTLMGWNSVVNAGMGGSTFQRALAETAVAMGKLDANTLKLEGKMKNVVIDGQSFRDSISAESGSGWLTSDVLTSTLEQFTGDMTKAELKAKGFTDAQVTSIQKMAATAKASATEVKTLSGVFDTAKEVAGSGWAKTWQLIFGDFMEAKTLFTGMSNAVNGVIEKMNSERNEALAQWKLLGGRNDLIYTFRSAWQSLGKILGVVKQAFTEIFPPVTGKNLKDITAGIRAFMKSLQPTKETLNDIKRVAKGVFAALDIGRMIVVGVAKVIGRLLGDMGKGSGGVLKFVAGIGDMIVKFRQTLIAGNSVNLFFKQVHTIISNVQQKVKELTDWFGNLFRGMGKVDSSGVTGAFDGIKTAIRPLESAGDHVRTVWEGLGDFFRGMFDFIKPIGEQIGQWIKGVGDTISNSMGNMDWNLVLDGINTGLFAGLVLLVRKFFKGGFQDEADGGGIIQHLKDVFGGITDTLGEMQNTLKAGTLVAIALAVALLAGSAVALAGVDSGKLTASLGALAVMFTQLLTAMAVFEKINAGTSVRNMVAIGTGMILLGIAIRILVESVEALGKLSWEELLKGLVGVTALLAGLAAAMKLLNGQSGKMASTGVGLILLAVAVKILASAVGDFAGMDWQKMMQGLIGVGIVLGGLALFTQVAKVSKGSMASSAGLILLGVALKIIASAVLDFANMNPATIQQGLGSVTAILMVLAGFTQIVKPSGMIGVGVAITIIAAALKILATAVTDFGTISWEVMGRGLAGMAGALAGIGIAMHLMPKNMIFTATALAIVAASLKILSEVLKSMGGMSWEEIGKGLVTLAGSLVVIAGAMYLMSGALVGAAALLVVVAALTLLVPVLQTLGGMSWETIGTGLGALAAALGVLAVGGLVLGILSPLFAAFGIALVIIGTGALLAGAGIFLFSAALTALSVATAIGGAAIVALIMAIASTIPAVMTQVGLGLVAFANVIATSAPAFGAAIMAVLNTLLNIINQMAPKIVATLWNLVVLMVEALVRGIPYLVNAGMRLLIGILQGIANNIGRIVTTVTDIIVNFLNALANNLPRIIQAGTNLLIRFIDGIRAAIPQLLQAGANLVLDFVNGLANTIRNNTSAMNTAGSNLAGAIIDGMTGGIAGGVKAVIDAAVNLGNSALQAAKDILGIKSPSRRFREVGEWSGEGMVIGLNSMAGSVSAAAGNMGDSAITALSSSISNMSSMISSDMDMNPTIRPVLDLSEIKKDSGLISGMLSDKSLALNGTYAKATVLSNGQLANREAISSKSDVVPTTGDTFAFTQINNSPKALSRSEIYRQTNNQISVAKGALTKK